MPVAAPRGPGTSGCGPSWPMERAMRISWPFPMTIAPTGPTLSPTSPGFSAPARIGISCAALFATSRAGNRFVSTVTRGSLRRTTCSGGAWNPRCSSAWSARGVWFDESFGVGTVYGSDEGADFLLQHLERGACIQYLPDLVVHHPAMAAIDREAVAKCGYYALGRGRLFRKHRFPWWFVGYSLARTSCGAWRRCCCCGR